MNETPFISVTMWSIEPIQNSEVVRFLTENFAKAKDVFAPTVIYGGYLTKRKNQSFDPNCEKDIKLFENCIYDKEVYSITLTNSDMQNRNVLFGFTIDFPPWATIIKFQLSHSYFVGNKEKQVFMSIVNDLICTIEPVFALIDDIEESIEILEKSGEETYQCIIDYVPTIFWGNYFGKKYIDHYGKDHLLNSPVGIVSELGNGVLITMNDDPLTYNSKECSERRKKLGKYLHVGKPISFRKFIGL